VDVAVEEAVVPNAKRIGYNDVVMTLEEQFGTDEL